jgi:hypothetical protein
MLQTLPFYHSLGCFPPDLAARGAAADTLATITLTASMLYFSIHLPSFSLESPLEMYGKPSRSVNDGELDGLFPPNPLDARL